MDRAHNIIIIARCTLHERSPGNIKPSLGYSGFPWKRVGTKQHKDVTFNFLPSLYTRYTIHLKEYTTSYNTEHVSVNIIVYNIMCI